MVCRKDAISEGFGEGETEAGAVADDVAVVVCKGEGGVGEVFEGSVRCPGDLSKGAEAVADGGTGVDV